MKPSFELATARAIRTLTMHVYVVSAALVLVLVLAIWGFVRANNATSSIQAQRAFLIGQNCENQNKRHTDTIAELDQELRRYEVHATAAQRKTIAASRQFTILLIDKLAPYQDCRMVVSKGTHG